MGYIQLYKIYQSFPAEYDKCNERINKKICRQKMSIMFNEICINEEILPKYTHTHTHTHIYIHIYMLVCCFVLRCINPFRAIQHRIKFQTIQFRIIIDFVYKRLNVKAVYLNVIPVLFQTIQFSISTQFSSI